MAAHVLVVAQVTARSADLLEALRARSARGSVHFTLLMPGQGPGLSGREAVRPRLEEAVQAWRDAGLQADGVAGDCDPGHAVTETWDPGRFDEVVVSTLPGQSSKWIAADLPHRIARLTGAPVMHVIATDMRPQPAHGPPPERERSPLGPLGVLAWGGKDR